VNVDTTVQEKAITFPTDARLYYKMREALVRAAESRNIELRQNYRRVAKRALSKQVTIHTPGSCAERAKKPSV
jgi:transposase, IS5 family